MLKFCYIKAQKLLPNIGRRYGVLVVWRLARGPQLDPCRCEFSWPRWIILTDKEQIVAELEEWVAQKRHLGRDESWYWNKFNRVKRRVKMKNE